MTHFNPLIQFPVNHPKSPAPALSSHSFTFFANNYQLIVAYLST